MVLVRAALFPSCSFEQCSGSVFSAMISLLVFSAMSGAGSLALDSTDVSRINGFSTSFSKNVSLIPEKTRVNYLLCLRVRCCCATEYLCIRGKFEFWFRIFCFWSFSDYMYMPILWRRLESKEVQRSLR